jgi:hypothetical protein
MCIINAFCDIIILFWIPFIRTPSIYVPSGRVAQLYLQAPGSLFITFCDSQGYGGGILIRLHTERESSI